MQSVEAVATKAGSLTWEGDAVDTGVLDVGTVPVRSVMTLDEPGLISIATRFVHPDVASASAIVGRSPWGATRESELPADDFCRRIAECVVANRAPEAVDEHFDAAAELVGSVDQADVALHSLAAGIADCEFRRAADESRKSSQRNCCIKASIFIA